MCLLCYSYNKIMYLGAVPALQSKASRERIFIMRTAIRAGLFVAIFGLHTSPLLAQTNYETLSKSVQNAKTYQDLANTFSEAKTIFKDHKDSKSEVINLLDLITKRAVDDDLKPDHNKFDAIYLSFRAYQFAAQ